MAHGVAPARRQSSTVSVDSVVHRRMWLLPLIGISPLLPARHSVATPMRLTGTRSVTTAITSHGVRLTLTLHRNTYPQDALVRALVSMRNISHHSVWLDGGGPMYSGKSFPQVEVLNAGTSVFPPAVTGYLPHQGPGPSFIQLAAGKTITDRPFIILRGPMIRATVPVLKGGRSLTTAGNVTTRALTIHLTASDAPQVQLHVSAKGHASATFVSPPPFKGELLYQDATWCSGTTYDQDIEWVTSYVLPRSGCIPTLSWHLVAGWPNHSVVTVNYTRPKP